MYIVEEDVAPGSIKIVIKPLKGDEIDIMVYMYIYIYNCMYIYMYTCVFMYIR